jgi:hypothetical protein
VAVVRTEVSEELIASTIRVSRISEQRSALRLLVIANVVSSSPILVTLMMEATCSFETSVLTKAVGHNMPEDGILHIQHRGNLKTYIFLATPSYRCEQYPI